MRPSARYGSSHYAHYQAALLALKFDDLARYRDIAMGMLNEFADTTNNDAAYFTAWTAAIVPGALDNYTPAVRLARQSFERHAAYYPYRVGLGAILLRAGH